MLLLSVYRQVTLFQQPGAACLHRVAFRLIRMAGG